MEDFKLIPSGEGKTVLLEIPRAEWRKSIARNIGNSAIVAGMVSLFTESSPHCIAFSVALFILLVVASIITVEVRIVADNTGISSYRLLGVKKYMPFADIRSAHIHFANGRGPTKMLRLSDEKKSVLDIYGVYLTEEQLSDIQDFTARRCLEVTGKPIEVTKLTGEDNFIPTRSDNDLPK